MLFGPCDQSTLVLTIYNREIVSTKKVKLNVAALSFIVDRPP
jgi:hypothetical protein